MFYLGVGILISRNRSPSLGLAITSGAAGLAAAIAASRVFLEYHTGEEVLIGLVFGVVCVAWFAAILQQAAAGPAHNPSPWAAGRAGVVCPRPPH